jgi:hypothetical protein
MSIGKGQAYAKQRQFEERVQELAQETLIPFYQRIIDMDPNQQSATHLRWWF